MDEDDRKNFNAGDEVVITILDGLNRKKPETRAEKRRQWMHYSLQQHV